jgi:hypothetical protein
MDLLDSNAANATFAEADSHLRITGAPGGIYVEELFLSQIASASWKSAIRHVEIDYDARVSSCVFMPLLPNAESLLIKGRHVRSINGIAACRALTSVVVRSSTRNLVSLAELADSSVTILHVEKVRADDLQAIQGARQLRKLTFDGGEIEGLGQISGMQLHGLNIARTNLKSAELAELETVKVVQLTNCTRLRGVGKESFGVGEMIIRSCREFDLKSLDAATRIRKLSIVKVTQPCELWDVSRLSGFVNI